MTQAKHVYYVVAFITCLSTGRAVYLSSGCNIIMHSCLETQAEISCNTSTQFRECIRGRCSHNEMMLAVSWLCLMNNGLIKFALMPNITKSCALTVRSYSLSYLPLTVFLDVWMAVYAVCRTVNSLKDRMYFVSGRGCTIDEYYMLVFEMCDPWNFPKPTAVSDNCQPGVDTCLNPITLEERLLPSDFVPCLMRYCNNEGVQYLTNRRRDGTKIMNEILTDVYFELKECPMEDISCYLQNRPSQPRWLLNLEANFSMCMGAADEWKKCYRESVGKTCTQLTVEDAVGNLCFDRYVTYLGISFPCDRQLSKCRRYEPFHNCRSLHKIESCLREYCTMNEIGKIVSGACLYTSNVGVVLWRIAASIPEVYADAVQAMRHDMVPPKLYDARTMARHTCFMFSSNSFLGLVKSSYLTGNDLMAWRGRIVSEACRSLANMVNIYCSQQAIKCMNKNTRRCADVRGIQNCLRRSCSVTETTYIVAETCRSLVFIQKLSELVSRKRERCKRKFIRCIGTAYIPGDEWYDSVKTQTFFCNAFHSRSFQFCILLDSFCSYDDYQQLLMTVCLRIARLHQLPRGSCYRQLRKCNYTFEKGCQGVINDLGCLRAACDDEEVRQLTFKACKVYELLGNGMYQVGFYNRPQCVIALLNCTQVNKHWPNLLQNNRYMCSFFRSQEEFRSCLAKDQCEPHDIDRIITAFCDPMHQMTYVSERCLDTAKSCYRNDSCESVEKNTKCIIQDCTTLEIIRVREHICNAERLVSYARAAGEEHGKAIVYCATSSPEGSVRERAPFEHYQDALCTALNMNSTYHCAVMAGANASVYNKVLVSACTVSFDSLMGIEDVCINAFTSCLQRLQPRNCSTLLNSISCNRNLCQLFSLKYLLNETCKTLNFLNAVLSQLNELTHECQNLAWNCFLLLSLPVEFWVDRNKLHRWLCLRVKSDEFRTCIQYQCPAQTERDLFAMACDFDTELEFMNPGSVPDVWTPFFWLLAGLLTLAMHD